MPHDEMHGPAMGSRVTLEHDSKTAAISRIQRPYRSAGIAGHKGLIVLAFAARKASNSRVSHFSGRGQ